MFHPGRCAAILHDGAVVGGIGELHPRLCKQFELPSAPVLFEVEVDCLLQLSLPVAQAVPRFPTVVRDIAVWVDGTVRAGEVLTDLQSLASRNPGLGMVRSVRLFDVFRPREGTKGAKDGATEPPTGLLNKEKSLAFRVLMQDTSRSLADADADAARASIVQHLQQRWGARVRE